MELNPPPVNSGWNADSKLGPLSVWALWFSNIWNAIIGSITPVPWTPIATNLTIVTGATLVGSYNKIGSIVHFVITITTTGSTASTAGTTTISLPLPATQNDVCFAVNGVTIASYGVGAIAAGASVLKPPTWGATANPVIISGSYRA